MMEATIQHQSAGSQNQRTAVHLPKERAAQERWALVPIRERLRVVRALRHLLAANADKLAAIAASVSNRPVEEKLVSEVLPLVETCCWLERNTRRVLTPRRHRWRGRPLWLTGTSFEVQRHPFGLVLVIGPRNYPLFLPAVHALHALAAGNAVLLKPAPGTLDVAAEFARLSRAAGLDPALLIVLPDTWEAGRQAIESGIDKVVFTGSSENGRKILLQLAATNTPAVMELSGRDPVIVLADADLDLVIRALKFGTGLNAGETCIAPHRLVVVETVLEPLRQKLVSAGMADRSIESVCDPEEAVRRVNDQEWALGASIFSRDLGQAQALAARIQTGFVLINDLIVPTADPRMPFGGLKASGFGSTRGPEGLLEMTYPHVVAVRQGRFHPHFEPTGPDDADFFTAYIRAIHGRFRVGEFRELINALVAKLKNRKTNL